MKVRVDRRAMALITTLMMSVVLLMMMLSLIQVVTTQSQQTRVHHDEIAALYAAEAGLADVMSRLELQSDWQVGFRGEPLGNRPGQYWVNFYPTGTAPPDDASINNLNGTFARVGPRGRMVPRGAALIVVTARVGMAERQLEAMLNSSGVVNVEYPLLTSDSIDLLGQINITGIKSLGSFERIPAGLHSNLRVNPADATIRWRPDPTASLHRQATVTGKVSSVDARGLAINFGSDETRYDVGAFERNAARQNFPTMGDITRQVNLHQDKPAPVLEPSGVTTLNSGQFYTGEDLEIHGDLVLDGGELFVNGDLTINGGIAGEGAIWASGKVTFKGDSLLQTSEKAAVMARRGVNLLGFNGDEYMGNFAENDPEVRALWEATKTELSAIQELVSSNDPASIVGPGGPLDQKAWRLGSHPDNPETPIEVVVPEDILVGGDYLGKLIGKLQERSASETRDFMIRKMESYQAFFSAAPEGEDNRLSLDFSRRPRTLAGAFDAVIDSGRVTALGALMTQVDNISYDKLGSSYFQGIIYTNGHFFASNSVTTLGAIMVDGRDGPSQPNPLNPGEEFKPGQLVLRRGANLTFVEDFFEEGENALRVRGPVRVRTWMAR